MSSYERKTVSQGGTAWHVLTELQRGPWTVPELHDTAQLRHLAGGTVRHSVRLLAQRGDVRVVSWRVKGREHPDRPAGTVVGIAPVYALTAAGRARLARSGPPAIPAPASRTEGRVAVLAMLAAGPATSAELIELPRYRGYPVAQAKSRVSTMMGRLRSAGLAEIVSRTEGGWSKAPHNIWGITPAGRKWLASAVERSRHVAP